MQHAKVTTTILHTEEGIRGGVRRGNNKRNTKRRGKGKKGERMKIRCGRGNE